MAIKCLKKISPLNDRMVGMHLIPPEIKKALDETQRLFVFALMRIFIFRLRLFASFCVHQGLLGQ